MIPPHLLHLVLSGPRHTSEAVATWNVLADGLRRMGYAVTTPIDWAKTAGATWGSIAFARTAARFVADADALVLAPDWQTCDHAVVCQVQAEALGLPVFEFDPVADVFVPVAA